MLQAPTGTVTFLFTDIEGSTRRWEHEPEAMTAALAAHDELLRNAIDLHGGVVFATGGDGFAAAFGRAADALACACDAQVQLHDLALPPVRMGIHSGEAVERDGDYFGPAVNRAARLMAIANGGQVVVSGTTQGLVSGFEFVDLGDHRLRDLSRPERVFQLSCRGLRADFPPLRSLDAYRGNLPLQLTSFVGRGQELRALAEAVRDARLVTIVGVGGVGKTRVAMQAAAEVVSEFRDGAWVCELATATDGETVAQVVGGALGVALQPGLSMESSIVEFLRTKQVLVVLDNCEHVLDAAGGLTDLVLRACADVRVLATSREPLALDGEHITALRSLPVGSTAAGSTTGGLDVVAASDSVRLFEDRARAARSGFAVDAINVAAVGEICRRLDGIPLAIELAAARVVAMSPSEIAALLDERFRLLTGGRRGSLERHQTLRATVEWSYGLLSSTERTMFGRLAVFSGFDVTAARAVVAGGDLDAWSALDALDGLVRKSMINAEEQAEGNTRYQMLETLRQYALEQLDAAGELELWRRQHARYYAEFAETVGPRLLRADEAAERARLYADLDNLRTASSWALDRDDPEDEEYGVRILAALAEDFALSARTRWALPSAERALKAARHSTPGRHAAVLASAAWEATARSDPEAALALGREALAVGITPDCPTPYRVCFAIANDGLNLTRTSALPFLEEVVARLETTDVPPAELARIHTLLLQAHVMRGNLDEARRWATGADEYARRSENPSVIAQVSYHLGTLWARDEPERAIAAYRQCIELSGVGGANDATFGAALFQCALLLARAGERNAALTDLRTSIEVQERMKQRPQLEGALAYAIEILTVLNAYEEAAVLAGAARGGALTHFKTMALPPERQQRNTSPLREYLGDRFEQHAARGAAMTFDEIVTWTLSNLSRLIEAT